METRGNVGAIAFRIGFWDILDYTYNQDPPPTKKKKSIGSYYEAPIFASRSGFRLWSSRALSRCAREGLLAIPGLSGKEPGNSGLLKRGSPGSIYIYIYIHIYIYIYRGLGFRGLGGSRHANFTDLCLRVLRARAYNELPLF